MHTCTSVAAATLLILVYAGPVRALDDGIGVQQSEEISDQVLSGVRGRFLAPGRIVRFGVEMVSTWQTGNGASYRAGATFDVAVGGKAEVRFVPALTVTEPAIAVTTSAQTNVVRGGAGLSSVSGVAQVIQVAADRNQITNSATVTVTRSDTGDAPAAAAVTCGARAAGSKLAVAARRFAAGRATCTWRVPRATRGRVVHATIGASVRGVAATARLVTRIR